MSARFLSLSKGPLPLHPCGTAPPGLPALTQKSENDIWKKGLSVYEVEKSIKGTDLPFEDDLHILYINGEYRGEDSLGVLMHDFSCPNPDDMKYEELAQKVRYYKQEGQGIKTMCKAVEDWGNTWAAEKVAERNVEFAKTLIKQNLLPIDKISEASGLSEEEVTKIAEELNSNVTVQ